LRLLDVMASTEAFIATTAVPLAVALPVVSLYRLRGLTRSRTGMAAGAVTR
jgi:hypothetical protein